MTGMSNPSLKSSMLKIQTAFASDRTLRIKSETLKLRNSDFNCGKLGVLVARYIAVGDQTFGAVIVAQPLVLPVKAATRILLPHHEPAKPAGHVNDKMVRILDKIRSAGDFRLPDGNNPAHEYRLDTRFVANADRSTATCL